MHKIKKLYSDSFQELKVTQNLVFCGMMAALAIEIGRASCRERVYVLV